MSTVRAPTHLLRQAHRTLSRTLVRRQGTRPQAIVLRSHVFAPSPAARCLSSSIINRAGLMPDTPDPQPPATEAEQQPTQATEVEEEEYHLMADQFMEAVYERAEQVQESRQDVEVEYSAGVLTITFPPNGTYVINKQPPNKQIWLSSPLSGPKRFDWVVVDESMDHKEGSGQGQWIYLRDGTMLADLLRKELGLDVGAHENDMEVSKDPTE